VGTVVKRKKIRGVCQRSGVTYRRFKVKRDGKWIDHYVRLPEIDDPRFYEELARVNGEAAERPEKLEGSIAALAVLYRERLATTKLASSTRTNKLYYVGLIEQEHGKKQVAALRRSKVIEARDKLAATPGKANNLLAVLKAMLEVAVDYDWIEHNPAKGVPLLALDEHDPWPKEVLEKALEAADPMLRLAIVTGLCTGQRISDVILIEHKWLDSGFMELSQLKTDVDVAVPVHPWWREEIAKVPRRVVKTILYDRFGRPFSGTDRIQERMRRLMHNLGYVDADEQLLYTFHGLRKNSCCYLLELGLSDTQVGAILGMTPETVRHYGKRARALVIAKTAAKAMLSEKRIGL
jgi:DNA-binding CsgD family transcriptional regulator